MTELPRISAVMAATATATATATFAACRREQAGVAEARPRVRVPRPPSTPSPHWLPTARGLVLEPLVSGHGQGHPDPGDRVRLWLRGWGAGEAPFVDVAAPQAPLLLAVGEAFVGLREALTLMLEGMRARVWLPASLAGSGQPAHPPGPLILEIELVQVLRARAPH